MASACFFNSNKSRSAFPCKCVCSNQAGMAVDKPMKNGHKLRPKPRARRFQDSSGGSRKPDALHSVDRLNSLSGLLNAFNYLCLS